MSEIALSPAVERPGKLTEDWSSVLVGLLVFFLALAGVAGVDLLGWAATTSVWIDPAQALGAVSKSYANLGGAFALAATFLALLTALSLAVWASGGDAEAFHARLHRRLRHRLCELVRRLLRASRGRDARGPVEIRHFLVAEADQRGRIHHRAYSLNWSSPISFRASRNGSRKRSGPNSISRSPSSSWAASSRRRRPAN